MSYATPADLIARFDSRIVGQLAEDTGVQLTPTQILTDPNVLACLSDGTSQINAAVLIAQRYTVAQIQALAGDDAAWVKRLNCDLAFCYLVNRRGVNGGPLFDQAMKRAEEALTALSLGHTILNVPANVGVGTAAEEFPDYATYATVGILRDRAWRLFPLRTPQAPASGGNSSQP